MIVETVPEPLLALTPELRVRFANAAFYETFGVRPEEAEGRLIYELGGGEWDLPELRRLLGEVLPENAAFEGYEVAHAFAGVGWRAVRLNGRRLDEAQLILLGVRDMTERRRAERALREAEWRQQQALEAGGLGTWTYDLAAGTSHFDERCRAVFGVDREAVSEEEVVGLIHPDDLEAFARSREAALDPASPDTFEEVHRIVRPDGAVRWVQGQARVFFEGEGAARRAVRAVGVVADVTGRKEAEEAVQALNRTLEARVEERTAEVRRLSAQLTVAEQEERQRIALILHDDLQQLLFALSMTLDRLAPAPSERESALRQRAADYLSRATDLTRSLAAELSPPVLQTPGIGVLLQWLAHREKRLHDLDVALDVRGDCRVPDPNLRALLYQILRELLFNVVKHAGVGEVAVRAWEEEGELTIQIEDEGGGFDVRAAAERKAEEGGFGLFSVQERVRLVGGRFEVTSAPGDGTRVTVAVRTEAAREGEGG